MINERNAYAYCSEDISNIENYQEAKNDTTQMWDIHHKLEMFMTEQELKDAGRYKKVPARELVFLTRKEHCWWPHKGREEAKKKLSEAMSGENHPWFGRLYTEESKKKMSESLRGKNHPMYGKHHSEETCERISKANTGKRRTLEQKKRISASKTGENNPLFGKHHSEETRKKMSEALLGNTNARGMHWWNNGTKCIMAKECPEGFVPGRLTKRAAR